VSRQDPEYRTELATLALLFLVGGGLFWRYDRDIGPNLESITSEPESATSAPMTLARGRSRGRWTVRFLVGQVAEPSSPGT
jgi:hypothetical protein